MARPHRNTPNKGRFKKGTSGNPGGMTREQREARDLIRELLKGEAETVHAMLMKRIKKGDSLLIRYAHEQLHGKAPDKLDLNHTVSSDLQKALAGLTVEDLRAGARDDGSRDE